jgi:hypothetical protein
MPGALLAQHRRGRAAPLDALRLPQTGAEIAQQGITLAADLRAQTAQTVEPREGDSGIPSSRPCRH